MSRFRNHRNFNQERVAASCVNCSSQRERSALTGYCDSQQRLRIELQWVSVVAGLNPITDERVGSFSALLSFSARATRYTPPQIGDLQ